MYPLSFIMNRALPESEKDRQNIDIYRKIIEKFSLFGHKHGTPLPPHPFFIIKIVDCGADAKCVGTLNRIIDCYYQLGGGDQNQEIKSREGGMVLSMIGRGEQILKQKCPK